MMLLIFLKLFVSLIDFNDVSAFPDLIDATENVDNEWETRAALVDSTWLRSSKCVTIGFNLGNLDSLELAHLTTPVLHIHSASMNTSQLKVLMREVWCVRYRAHVILRDINIE